MSIASELTNLEGNIEDSYDAVNDMGGIIPAHKNMNNLDQAIRTIPQNTGITSTTFHWGGSPNYSMYKDSGYTTAATYSDIATAYANGLVYIADGEDEVTYVVVSDIPDANTITVTGIGLPDYEGASASYTYASSTWAKTATEFQKKLTAGTNVQINGTTISATDTTYSDMVGATSLDAGTHGLVPAPSAGDEDKVLSGAGTWVAQTAAQVNSDWNAVSGVSQILNKPTIPAAQVNSDWDAASGVAQILNKPSLATVATSGAYSDLTGTPTIPAAQIQSDWTQTTTTALDYIKNKPEIRHVNSVSDAGWSADANKLVDGSVLAYWNGAYSGTNSNLQYFKDNSIGCNHFNEWSTANTTDTWVPVGNGNKIQHRVIKAFNADGTIPKSAMHGLPAPDPSSVITNWGSISASGNNEKTMSADGFVVGKGCTFGSDQSALVKLNGQEVGGVSYTTFTGYMQVAYCFPVRSGDKVQFYLNKSGPQHQGCKLIGWKM